MRIAFINNTKAFGGVKTWCLDMGKSFLDAGHAPLIVGRDSRFIDKAKSLGLEAVQHITGVDYSIFDIAFYRRILIKYGIQVAVVNVGKDRRSAGFSARLLGLPIIVHIGAPNDLLDTLQTRLDDWLLSPYYICCSQFVLDNICVNVPHISRRRSIAIHPGTTPPDTVPVRFANDPIRLITTSRLHTSKQHIDVLKALVQLQAEGFRFHLTIVGDGPYRPALENYVQENNLSEKIHFTGFTANVGSYLEKSDVFILPTPAEPFGIALAEAMANGLVPIARKAGGVPEIWPQEYMNLLIESSHNDTGFAQVLRNVLRYPVDVLRKISADVRSHAVNTFAQEKQYQKFYQWIQDIHAGRWGNNSSGKTHFML